MVKEETICKANPGFSFLIGDHAPYKLITNNFFFHTREFLSGQNVFSFYILNNKLKVCEGIFHLSIYENIGYSALKAPFGSIDVSSSISTHVLDEYFDFILNWCLTYGLQAIKIRHYPHCYDQEGSVLIQNSLFNKGFEIINTDVGQYINILPDTPAFSRSARIKMNKCKRAGFMFKVLEKSHLKEAYFLLKACKDRKSYPTNIGLEDLEKSFLKFPDRYLIFGVMDNRILISASICVVINNSILYDFSHGHLWEYRKFSPVVLLVDGILHYCFKEDYKILDLGLSTDNSIINTGLYDFKSRLGALPSLKLSYSKYL